MRGQPDKRRIRKLIKNSLLRALIVALVWVVGRVPRRWAVASLGLLGRAAYLLIGSARRQVLDNLALAFGTTHRPSEIARMARGVFVDLGRNLADCIRLPRLGTRVLDRIVVVDGWERIDRTLAQGRGMMGVSAHFGAWELLSGYLAMKGYPVTVIGAPLYDPYLNRMLVGLRASMNVSNIDREGKSEGGGAGARLAARQALRVLRRGEVLGVLIDQDTRVEGTFVDFFGLPAYTPAIPAKMALRSNAAVLPMFIFRRSDGRHQVIVEDELKLVRTGNEDRDVQENTQRMTAVIERVIRQHPTQWVWMHERWKTRPSDIGGVP